MVGNYEEIVILGYQDAAKVSRSLQQILVREFVRDESGEDLIEYGLLAAFVATVATAVVIGDPIGLQDAIVDAYQRCVDALKDASAEVRAVRKTDSRSPCQVSDRSARHCPSKPCVASCSRGWTRARSAEWMPWWPVHVFLEGRSD